MDKREASVEELQKLQLAAEKAIQENDFEAAIICYKKALALPASPLPAEVLRAIVLYEKRGSCYLALHTEFPTSDCNYLELALEDAEKAVKLNDQSWKGHHISGVVHREMGDLIKARYHIFRALEICPGEVKVKADFEICKLLQKKSELADLTEPLTRFRVWTLNPSEEVDLPGHDLFIKGLQYKTCGDFTKAREYFETAAKAGSTLGLYHLAQMHLFGMGTKRNISKGIELLLKAEKKPPFIIDRGLYTIKDVGVQLTQHCLGVLYEEGIYFDLDTQKAAIWYKKAADNGLGYAANKVAAMHCVGVGFPMNDKLAVIYWKIGLRDKNISCAQQLYSHFKKQLEPELARAFYEMVGDIGGRDVKGDVLRDLDRLTDKRKQYEQEVVGYESNLNFDMRGMTFQERLERMARMTYNLSLVQEEIAVAKKVKDKYFLHDPRRIELILKQRKCLAMEKVDGLSQLEPSEWNTESLLTKTEKSNTKQFKITWLLELNPVKEFIYEGRILTLTLVEDAIFTQNFIHYVGEDENGEVVEVEVMADGEDMKFREIFQIGASVCILNPHMKVSKRQRAHGIVVDCEKSLIHLATQINKCRFCGLTGAKSLCGKCKQAKYCDRGCQKMDWKILGHKIVCCPDEKSMACVKNV